MQMVMMVFRTSLEHEVLPWVDQEQLPYTRLDGAQGKGTTGTVPGSVTWGGGANSILLVVVPDDRLWECHFIFCHALHSMAVTFHDSHDPIGTVMTIPPMTSFK
jgi:hypothetical protein